jgi:hypothetical protein
MHPSNMTANQNLLAVLTLLEKIEPPPPGAHHAITCAQYGSDETGWEYRLALNLRYAKNGTEQTKIFFLEDGDLEKVPGDLVKEVVDILRGEWPEEWL